MRWFEFMREANESFDFENYIDRHWESLPVEEDIWVKISCEPLDEGFIERHDIMVDWKAVSKYSKLSSAFMDKYSNCLDWEAVSRYQNLTAEFMNQHRYELDWNIVLTRYQCKEQIILDLLADPYVDIDLGVILSTQKSLRPTTVAILTTSYRNMEIQRNLTLHPKEDARPFKPTEPEKKTGWWPFNKKKKGDKKHDKAYN